MTEPITEVLRELEALIATPEVQRPILYVCRFCGLRYYPADEHDAEACAARKALSEVDRRSEH